MRRRDFVTVLGGVAAWPLVASPQQKPVIGFLNSGSADAYSDRIAAFHEGLRELGYIDGENVVIGAAEQRRSCRGNDESSDGAASPRRDLLLNVKVKAQIEKPLRK
jgi:hypothetical protein